MKKIWKNWKSWSHPENHPLSSMNLGSMNPLIFFQWIHPASVRPLGETSLQNPRGSVFAISPSTQLQLGNENPWVFSYGYITWISSEYMYMSVDVYMYIYGYLHMKQRLYVELYLQWTNICGFLWIMMLIQHILKVWKVKAFFFTAYL